MESRPPLLVILGPTASGKSSLGLAVARELDGEIISADAFAVYRGLTIGTDKPSLEDRRLVPHHLVDCLDPHEVYSAGAFAEAARAAIHEIFARGRLPVVVGGTHFYIRALLHGLFPAPPRDPAIGEELARRWDRDPAALYGELQEADPVATERIGANDRQRILRALEVFESTGEPVSSHWRRHHHTPEYAPLLVAPRRSRADLYARINARVDSMFASGLVEEVAAILASGVPREAHALKAIGYRETIDFITGHSDLTNAIEQTKRASRRFAKRQLTWLRDAREGTVHWVPPIEDGGAAAVIRLWNTHTEERRES
jgi:tRNA dimethylallyltransferase